MTPRSTSAQNTYEDMLGLCNIDLEPIFVSSTKVDFSSLTKTNHPHSALSILVNLGIYKKISYKVWSIQFKPNKYIADFLKNVQTMVFLCPYSHMVYVAQHWLWARDEFKVPQVPWPDTTECHNRDSKVHGANMGPTWVLSAPDGPHVGPMNLAVREHKRHIQGLGEKTCKIAAYTLQLLRKMLISQRET